MQHLALELLIKNSKSGGGSGRTGIIYNGKRPKLTEQQVQSIFNETYEQHLARYAKCDAKETR
jgi:hypothetical protein